jgi:deoxyribodipyrimidine photo-lyase
MPLADLSTVDSDTALFWFRRDLRLDDNTGLYHALRDHGNVLGLFIFDTHILDTLEDRADARVTFIHDCLKQLAKELEAFGSSLLVLHGDPVDLFCKLSPAAVYTNRDYEPYARTRDETVGRLLEARGIPFKTFKDQVIFEQGEIVKDDGTPYTVFTPYSKKWKSVATSSHTKGHPTEKYQASFRKVHSLPMPALGELGFSRSTISFPPRVIRTKVLKTYDATRNFPAIEGTSRLSVHLRFGTVSIRKLVRVAQTMNESWLNELIWREFYMMILFHFPHVVNKSFKPAYDHIRWRNDPDEFAAWCEGRTGYPIVDAGMRELNATGYMHNRVRMITASFLTKHLLIDWRWGEAYFAQKLLDFDLAANNGGWQWSAGSGCDAAPYFRVFNPELQTKKFDPELAYVRKWIPELDSGKYPNPMVDHSQARERVLNAYAVALGKNPMA